MTADKYINGTLKALKDGEIYNSPDGAIKSIYQRGSIVGEIFSWVEKPSGVWWQLKEGGYVKHAPGKFDADMVEKTAQNYNETEQVFDIADLGGDLLGDLLGDFSMNKLIVIIVLIIITLVIFNKSISKLIT